MPTARYAYGGKISALYHVFVTTSVLNSIPSYLSYCLCLYSHNIYVLTDSCVVNV
jgi:hypothetical protein